MKEISASVIVFSGAFCFGVGSLGKYAEFAMFIGIVVMAFGVLAWLGIPKNRKEADPGGP